MALGSRHFAAKFEDIPDSYCPLPVCTDGYSVYAKFFEGTAHEICEKGSGKTRMAEAWNTKWHQWQSALVRRSCGVCRRMELDAAERFLILLEAHNRERIADWLRTQTESLKATA